MDKTVNYQVATRVQEIIDYIGHKKTVAFDFETAPKEGYRDEDKAALDPAKSHIVGCSFSVEPYTGIYVPLAHKVGTNIDKDDFMAFLKAFLSDTNITKVAHNIAFESAMAYYAGWLFCHPSMTP